MMIPKLTFHDDRRLRFTGDTHFGHNSQAIRRGYDDIDQHDNDLIHNWNREVGPDDFCFHVGDFAWKQPPERLAAIFKRLNGRKYLVLGNHDDEKVCALPWAAPPVQRMLIQIGSGEDQKTLCLDHFGGRTWYNSHRGVVQLYGHSHGELPSTKASCDVGVDAWLLQPITLEDVLAEQKAAKITLREVQDLIPGGPRNA